MNRSTTRLISIIRTMPKLLGALLVFPALQFIPTLIFACPRCYGSTDSEGLQAYLFSVLFLSLLPLGILAAIFYTVRRQCRPNSPSEPSSTASNSHRAP